MTDRTRAMRRWLATPIRSLDRGVARLRAKQRILAEIRTPMHLAVLGPIIEALESRADLDVRFTSEYPERIRPLVPDGRFLTHADARWQRFDLYINADPWGAVSLARCEARINFFHGVAGKYDLDNPKGLPMGFEYYDRVAFINSDRMTRYLNAGVVTPKQAVLIGYPKLDRLASGQVDGKAVAVSLGLDAGRPTALYAPTYSAASSLHAAGAQIISSHADHGFNVIVKLHDRSLDGDVRYTGGIDWRRRMHDLGRPAAIKYVEGPDASPFLAAADRSTCVGPSVTVVPTWTPPKVYSVSVAS